MADRRTRKKAPITDESDYYSPLRDKRDINRISFYSTPMLKHPTIAERSSLKTTKHIWRYGDRLTNLADQYYGDYSYWWVIAWYNGVATEAQLNLGQVMYIPLNLADTLDVLGV